jgi:hypothetical protein
MSLPRPTLLAGVARSQRGPRTVQLGADPDRAVVIDLPDPRAARVLDLLDGSRPDREVVQSAAASGLSAGETRALIDTLIAAGYVQPAASLAAPIPSLAGEAAALALQTRSRIGQPPDSTAARILRRRAASRVLLTGSGRLAAPIAVALAAAGVGQIHPELSGTVAAEEVTGGPLTAADAGRPRAAAVVSALARTALAVHTGDLRRGPVTLVIQLGHDQPVALLAAAHLSRRRPHLAVGLREGVPAVGPFVPATGAPCLNCIDLHRRDRDPGWTGFLPATAEPCAVATVLAATALATAESLAVIDGDIPQTRGVTIEVHSPGVLRRRTWHPHPSCRCARVRRSPPARPRLPVLPPTRTDSSR